MKYGRADALSHDNVVRINCHGARPPFFLTLFGAQTLMNREMERTKTRVRLRRRIFSENALQQLTKLCWQAMPQVCGRGYTAIAHEATVALAVKPLRQRYS